jgi:hypothetical protein
MFVYLKSTLNIYVMYLILLYLSRHACLFLFCCAGAVYIYVYAATPKQTFNFHEHSVQD